MANAGGVPPGDIGANMAVLLERSDAQGRKLEEMSSDIKGFGLTYATRREVDDVREDVRSIKGGINWTIKLVVGAVIIAVLGLVIAKGGMHP